MHLHMYLCPNLNLVTDLMEKENINNTYTIEKMSELNLLYTKYLPLSGDASPQFFPELFKPEPCD